MHMQEVDEPHVAWLESAVDAYACAARDLELESLPFFEKHLLERILIELVLSWTVREKLEAEADLTLVQRDCLIDTIRRVAEHFTRNVWLDYELERGKVQTVSENGIVTVDYRDPRNADFKIQPRYPRLCWQHTPTYETPILYMSFCGAQESLIGYLKREQLSAPYIKYVELINILKSQASFCVKEQIYSNVRAKTKWFSGKRNETAENDEAELLLFMRTIAGPSLWLAALLQGNRAFLFSRFLWGGWRAFPMIAATVCAALGSVAGTVFFGLWFLRNVQSPPDPSLDRINKPLIIYNDFIRSLSVPEKRIEWYPRSVYEIQRIVDQLIDVGESMPVEVVLLLNDLTGHEYLLDSNLEYFDGAPFDGKTLRLALDEKLAKEVNRQ